MSERNLYRGLNDFQGSIDDDGNLYDEMHRLVGRIEGNDVYDYCNIKQGSIDENGKLWDCNHTFVGQEHGSNFIGPSYQSTGLVRGDSPGEGGGSEYGALMMLKKRNYSGNIPDNNYEFGDGNEVDDDYAEDPDEDYDEDEDEDYDSDMDDDSEDVWDDDCSSSSQVRKRKAHRNGCGQYRNDNPFDGSGCMSVLVVVFSTAALFWLFC